MAKSIKKTEQETVSDYFDNLKHPMFDVVQAIRKVIVGTDKEIGEQIKWNSLCLYYTGDMKPFNPKEYKRDIVVFNLMKQESVLLVFPTGAVISDKSGLLEGKFTDGRKVIKFSSVEQVKERQKDLKNCINDWLSKVEKP
jgi:hypothetical protein